MDNKINTDDRPSQFEVARVMFDMRHADFIMMSDSIADLIDAQDDPFHPGTTHRDLLTVLTVWAQENAFK